MSGVQRPKDKDLGMKINPRILRPNIMAFFLTCEDLGKKFNDSLPALFFEVEISSHTPVHLLGQDQASGSAS